MQCVYINTLFQTPIVFDAQSAYADLIRYFKSMKRRIFKSGPRGDAGQLKDVDFGTAFLNECSKYEYGKEEFEKNRVADLKNRCWAFLPKLVEEIEKDLHSSYL